MLTGNVQFSTSFVEGAFVVVGLINLLLPTTSPPPNRPELQPSYYLPSEYLLSPGQFWAVGKNWKSF